MIAGFVILAPVVAAVAWAFLRFSPAHADRTALRRFNGIAIAAALLLAAGWTVRTYLVMAPTVDAPWWPVISALGALVVIACVLGVAALVRGRLVVRGRGGR
ncbi:MAG: hypothetical protein HYV94_22335 [Candidatus Rokubacteria bacterium]|nr:hypothetical protein [Candidatus Rokubacteria bacterium]